jgi:hypothetical protein
VVFNTEIGVESSNDPAGLTLHATSPGAAPRNLAATKKFVPSKLTDGELHVPDGSREIGVVSATVPSEATRTT